MDGYDKDSRPVHNDSDIIVVEVDLTYRQVLDMDEKNQILTSLVWYRKASHSDLFRICFNTDP